MRHATRAALCAGLALAVAATAAPAEAQAPNLQLVPKIGMSMPLGTLADNTEIDMGLAFGLAAELVLPRLPFSVRANLDFAREADVTQRTAAAPVLGQATILVVTGDIVLRPLPPTAVAQPYFLGGAGIKRHDIAIGPVADTPLRTGITTRATLHVGGGFDVRLGPLSGVLEISDYISTFPDADGGSRLQNTIFGMIGFRVAMF